MSLFDTQPVLEWMEKKDECDRIESALERAKEERDQIAERVMMGLAEAGLPSVQVERDGVRYTVHPSMILRPKRNEGVEARDVVDALKTSGLATLVYETYNTNTLGAWAREELAENRPLPPALAACLSFTEDRTLRASKSTSRESRSSQAAATLRAQSNPS